ncbi:MAG: M12 family metallo-peptidase [Methylomonas sp.]
MKTSIIKPTAIAAAIAAIFANSVCHADSQSIAERLKVQPVSVYQAIHGQALAETLAQFAQRSGITFKINTDIGQDRLSQSVAAENWNEAVKALLANYNFSMIQDGDIIKTVIVTGRKNDGMDAQPIAAVAKHAAQVDGVIVVERKMAKLPAKYQGFPAGSVTPVKLPVGAMMKVADKSTVGLDLPMGQFNVAHDNTINEENGNNIWIGHLADEGLGYRVYLSQGAAGVMGMVTTPDGTYNIESDQSGATYLVDTGKLQHAGFPGDAVAPTAALTAAAEISANATVAQINQLQAAATAAQTALNAANAQVVSDQAALSAAQSQLTAAQSNLAAANAQSSAAYNGFLAAIQAYFSHPSMALFYPILTEETAMQTAKTAVANAQTAELSANSAFNIANSTLAKETATAATAQANYNQAEAALAAAQASTTQSASTTSPAATTGSVTTGSAGASNTVTPVVDLMVVYTTVAYTQAYALQRIQLLVAASNQAYVDSSINMTLRLVHTQSTSYVENNSNAQALSDLANGDGAFAGISQTRAQYGADLVFLFRPLYAETAGSCGTTLLGFAGGQSGNPALGYGTIGDGNSVDEPGYYCGSNSFTHEIGHSLGLVHDRPNANSPGVFPYAYAWGINGTFGTIMSYDQPMLMYFSTPLLNNQCAGQPCGYAQNNPTQSSDQTSSVNYTAPIVANFMPAKTVTPVLN